MKLFYALPFLAVFILWVVVYYKVICPIFTKKKLSESKPDPETTSNLEAEAPVDPTKN